MTWISPVLPQYDFFVYRLHVQCGICYLANPCRQRRHRRRNRRNVCARLACRKFWTGGRDSSSFLGFMTCCGIGRGCINDPSCYYHDWKNRRAYGNIVSVVLCTVGVIVFAIVYGINKDKYVEVSWVSYVCCPVGMSTPDCTDFCRRPSNGKYDTQTQTYTHTPLSNEVAGSQEENYLCLTSGGSKCSKQSKCTPEFCGSHHPSGFSHFPNCWADPDSAMSGSTPDCTRYWSYEYPEGVDEAAYIPLKTNKTDQRKLETTSLAFSLVTAPPRPPHFDWMPKSSCAS